MRRLLAFTAIGLGALCLAPAARADFGLQPGPEGFVASAMRATGTGAVPEMLSGSHPFELLGELRFNHQGSSPPISDGDLRDFFVDLPPGLIANPRAVTQCPQVRFRTPRISPFGPTRSGESCPDTSQVGVITLTTEREEGHPLSFGIFDVEPRPGSPSALGAAPFGVPVTMSPRVREEGGNFALTVELRNFPQFFDVTAVKVEMWGVPWSPAHDGQRGNCLKEEDPDHPYAKCQIEARPPHATMPYLTMPTDCLAPLRYTVRATSWEGDSATASVLSRDAEGKVAPLQGCDQVLFEPNPVARLTTTRTTSSTGFDFTLDGNAFGLINPDLRAGTQARDATIALADGVTINPSLGAGLGFCTPAQYAAIKGNAGPDCPNDSKIGEVEVESPLFVGPIKGGVYLAQPDDLNSGEAGAENPFDALIGLYIVARSPLRGIAVKLPGELEADPANGNLVGRFRELPQLPYSHFNVHFRDGQRSPLASPATCGAYSDRVDLVPVVGSVPTTCSSRPSSR